MSKQSILERTIIAILADDETIQCFSLTGIPSFKESRNLIPVTSDCTEEDLVGYFYELINRKDVAILFIADFVMQKIKREVEKYTGSMPSVIEIPSKLGKNKYSF